MPELEIKKANIHFIYSFLPVSKRNKMFLTEDMLENFSNIFQNIGDSKLQTGIGKPENRLGLSSYIDLDLEMAYMKFPEVNGTVDDIDIKIEPLIRIFPIGSSCCLTVTASEKKGEKLTVADVHKLLCIVSKIKNESSKSKIKLKKVEDNSIYKFGNDEITIYQLFIFIVESILVKTFNSDECRESIELLCQNNIRIGEQREPQVPWTVTVLEVEGSSCEAFCNAFCNFSDMMTAGNIKTELIKNYERLLSPILFNTVPDFKIEPAYLYLPVQGKRSGIFSMNVDSRLFVQMSRRSILCICEDKEKDPAKYFIPNLLDLCEMSFSRLQTLIILNKTLDDTLRNFTEEEKSPRMKLKEIIEHINRFTTAFEDPTAYIISGESLREIREELIYIFRLNTLTETILRKIEMLERLYKYNLELRWATSFEEKLKDND